ncbi:MAG TPA: hypothetical protein PLH57_01950 [Oligoflexia bacterium]|nr:hypothetical protein [Oligoflexia bacterium]
MGINIFYAKENRVLKKNPDTETEIELIVFNDRIKQVLPTDHGLIVILGGKGSTKPGNIFLINASSGTIVWQSEPCPGLSIDGKDKKEIYASARVEDGKLIARAYDGLEHEVDWQTGKHLKVTGLRRFG